MHHIYFVIASYVYCYKMLTNYINVMKIVKKYTIDE